MAREADVDGASALGFGVMLFSAEGRRVFRWGAGVLTVEVLRVDDLRVPILGMGKEASDMGGDGGSWSSDAVSAVDNDFVSGGVVIIGELAVERGELRKDGEPVMEMSVDRAERWRASCFLILACRISASIFKSESSSRSLCASTRSFSLSCSPILISSSRMTPLSIAMLYLDSRSSSEDVVVRA